LSEEVSGTTRIIVYADFREEKSGIPSLIEAEGIPVVRKNLPVGDYLVSGEVVIERKTAWDFAHSLFDGRLFDQARRMSEDFPTIVFLVEGDPLRLRRYRHLHKQFYAAIATLTIDFDAKIIYTEGPHHSAYVIASIARRLAKEGRRPVAFRKRGKIETISDWQLFILQSFPGVGEKTAKKIMESFRTLRDFCNASRAEIARIEGIGEKKADLIFTVLNRRFEITPTKRARRTLEDFYEPDK
jgi:DNA excision repair protein ERCC-4